MSTCFLLTSKSIFVFNNVAACKFQKVYKFFERSAISDCITYLIEETKRSISVTQNKVCLLNATFKITRRKDFYYISSNKMLKLMQVLGHSKVDW